MKDGTINSATNPAPAGSVVSIFGTGFGVVGSTIPDGGITPIPPAQYPGAAVEASWFTSLTNQYTLPVPIRYAGAAPLEVEGVGRINFRPAGAPDRRPLATVLPSRHDVAAPVAGQPAVSDLDPVKAFGGANGTKRP